MLQQLTKPFAWFWAPLDKFGLYALIWSMATIAHQFTFTRWLEYGVELGWALTFLAVLVFAFPQISLLFLSLVVCSVSYTYQIIPGAPNHIFFEWWINLGFIVSFVLAWFQLSRPTALDTPEFRERVMKNYIPLAVYGLLALYFWTLVHKLNWDYLDLKYSCGVSLLKGMVWRLNYTMEDFMIPFQFGYDFPKALRYLAIWGSLFFEALIPILLLFRKTRIWGVGIGIFFHTLLSIHPHDGIYSFSALIMGLYVNFIPDTSLESSRDLFKLPQLKLSDNQLRWGVFGLILLGIISLIILETLFTQYRPLFRIGFFYWLFLAFISFRVWNRARRLEKPGSKYSLNLVTVLIPILIFANGLNPYLGLKTESSFSMFSNLRTEIPSNHLFIPESMKIFNYQEERIEVIYSDKPVFRADGYHKSKKKFYTAFIFKNRMSKHFKKQEDMEVHFKYNDELHKLIIKDGEVNMPEWVEPSPYWKLKMLTFRPIYVGPSLCQH